jgi:hypothetical protein
VRALRQAFDDIQSIDFFQAEGRDAAAAALAALERRAAGEQGAMGAQGSQEKLRAAEFKNRLWVTRPRPGIDRMGCAWLIRRFIDSRARFGFAAKLEKASKAIPFDMFGARFAHQGSDCSFETLIREFAISDPAIPRLAQIVHALDLKDDKFAPPEAAAVGRLVEGLRHLYSNDQELLDRGAAIFEALYCSFSGEPAGAGHRAKGTRGGRARRRGAAS